MRATWLTIGVMLGFLLGAGSAGASTANVRLKLTPGSQAVPAGSRATLHVHVSGLVPRDDELVLEPGGVAVGSRGGSARISSAKSGTVRYTAELTKGHRVLARSATAVVDWTVLLPTYFQLTVLDSSNPVGGAGAYFQWYSDGEVDGACGLVNSFVNDSFPCPGSGFPGEVFQVKAYLLGLDSTSPFVLPQGWKLSVTVNAIPFLCLPNSPETQCQGSLQLPPSGTGSELVVATLKTSAGKSYAAQVEVSYAPPQEL
jgi:hypothetical protein